MINQLRQNVNYKLESSTTKFNNLESKRILLNPLDLFVKYNNTLELVINKLELLNPLSVLSKGYSVTKVNNKVITNSKDVKVSDKLNIKLLDGEIDAVVEGVK